MSTAVETKRDVNADALLEVRQCQRLDWLRCLQSSVQMEVLGSVLWKERELNEAAVCADHSSGDAAWLWLH